MRMGVTLKVDAPNGPHLGIQNLGIPSPGNQTVYTPLNQEHAEGNLEPMMT